MVLSAMTSSLMCPGRDKGGKTSPDNGVELLCVGQIVNIRGLEGDLREASLLRTGLCQFKRTSIAIHAEDKTHFTDQLGGDQADIARSTTDIQHRHPTADPSVLEQAPGEWVEQPTLPQ
jgi:hypothetical protein